jgi:hypothetical protein
MSRCSGQIQAAVRVGRKAEAARRMGRATSALLGRCGLTESTSWLRVASPGE